MYDVDLTKLIVMDVRAVNRIHMAKNEINMEMRRWSSAFGIMINGKCTIQCDGKVLTADSNHAVFVPRGSNCIETCEEDGTLLWINVTAWYFDDNYIKDYLDEGNLRTIAVDRALVNATVFEITNVKALSVICERIERILKLNKPYLKTKCMRDVYDIISKIQTPSDITSYHRSPYNIVQPAIDYIELNYSDRQLNNTRLAVVAGISEVYLRKQFSNLFGITPAKYVTDVRIEKAKSMLTSGIMSVSEVAEAVGFSNIYHFSKTFKRITGYTPTEYAKKENSV